MSSIDKIELLHPIRRRAIKYDQIRSCQSCQYSKYVSYENEGQMDFKGCDVIDGITAEPKRCSKFSISEDVLCDEERKYYEEQGICWL